MARRSGVPECAAFVSVESCGGKDGEALGGGGCSWPLSLGTSAAVTSSEYAAFVSGGSCEGKDGEALGGRGSNWSLSSGASDVEISPECVTFVSGGYWGKDDEALGGHGSRQPFVLGAPAVVTSSEPGFVASMSGFTSDDGNDDDGSAAGAVMSRSW